MENQLNSAIIPNIELALRCTPIVCPMPLPPEYPWAGSTDLISADINLGVATIETFDRYCSSTLFCVNLPTELTTLLGTLNVDQYRTLTTILKLKAQGSSVWYSSSIDWYASLSPLQKDILIEAYTDGVLKSAYGETGPPPELEALSSILPIAEFDVMMGGMTDSLTAAGIDLSAEISELDLVFEAILSIF